METGDVVTVAVTPGILRSAFEGKPNLVLDLILLIWKHGSRRRRMKGRRKGRRRRKGKRIS